MKPPTDKLLMGRSIYPSRSVALPKDKWWECQCGHEGKRHNYPGQPGGGCEQCGCRFWRGVKLV